MHRHSQTVVVSQCEPERNGTNLFAALPLSPFPTRVLLVAFNDKLISHDRASSAPTATELGVSRHHNYKWLLQPDGLPCHPTEGSRSIFVVPSLLVRWGLSFLFVWFFFARSTMLISSYQLVGIDIGHECWSSFGSPHWSFLCFEDALNGMASLVAMTHQKTIAWTVKCWRCPDQCTLLRWLSDYKYLPYSCIYYKHRIKHYAAVKQRKTARDDRSLRMQWNSMWRLIQENCDYIWLN